MKCLTKAECSEWLRSQKMIEAPYGQPLPADCFYERFVTPKDVRFFSQSIFYWFDEFDSVLLQMTDWNDTRIPENIADDIVLMEAIRCGHGETRSLDDAPGHLFKFDERDEVV
ncbi:MAG: hypothetical protein ABSF34_15330, partial [Verrucomicrobiota bacterium]